MKSKFLLNSTFIIIGVIVITGAILFDSCSACSSRPPRPKTQRPSRQKHYTPSRDTIVVSGDTIFIHDTINDRPRVVIPDEDFECRKTVWIGGESDMENLKEACDYNCPYVRTFACKIAKQAEGEFNIDQICLMYDYCVNNWGYVSDPSGSEYLNKASESIKAELSGDCDDFAVLMASCLLAIGGDVRIVLAYGLKGGHAYAEVDISAFNSSYVNSFIHKRYNTNAKVYTRSAYGRTWLNLDWWRNDAGIMCPGGRYYEASELNNYYCIESNWYYN